MIRSWILYVMYNVVLNCSFTLVLSSYHKEPCLVFLFRLLLHTSLEITIVSRC
ncbi:uncharacterized protein Smp_203880 [Schistosoma mansoni]|uniref:uncharacterized protein n=1 Tax=Schistosoma mansoni TaxID=6183 RepID=UPI00022DCA53|nr:uncharacterized protein Smp_203880 [Schistosoma mansoni]|eukprot:XP_018655334.1 uncharacterized protein Smp_203880 [Schistosoma mansoni]